MSNPRSSSDFANAGCRTTVAISLCSFCTISGGVPAGENSPNQIVAAIYGKFASLTVGTSGNALDLEADPIAIGFARPEFKAPVALLGLTTVICTSFAITAVNAGAKPL